MLKPLALKLAGALVAVGPLLLSVLSVLTRGWRRTTGTRARPMPPDTINDPKWGEHRSDRDPYY